MIKKIIIFVILSIVSSSIIIYPAQSSNIIVKNNSNCMISGSTIFHNGFLYKCSKSKKSLTWKKVRRLSNNQPTSLTVIESSTAVSKPISVILESATVVSESSISVIVKPAIQSIWEKSFLSFADWASNNKTVKNNHFVYKNSDIPEHVFLSVNKTELLAKDIFGNIVKHNTYSYYGGEDLGWFYRQKHLVPGDSKENICNQPWDNLAACPNMIDAIFYRAPHDNYSVEGNYAPLGAHEYFHLVQATLGGIGPNFDARSFRWFMEGGAEFVGNAVASIALDKPYDSLISEKDKVFYDIHKDPYVSGRMFFEFLVSEYGFSSILKILSEYKVGRDFNKVFKDNTGFTIDEFLNKFKKESNV